MQEGPGAPKRTNCSGTAQASSGAPARFPEQAVPALLTYVVEQKLLGNAEYLKERTIGIEPFGREPDDDVNADPVVRTSTAEVRKRLIQYYYDLFMPAN